MSEELEEKFITAVDTDDIDTAIRCIRSSGLLQSNNGLRRYAFLNNSLDDPNDSLQARENSLIKMRLLLHEPTKAFMGKLFREVVKRDDCDVARFLLEEVPNKIDINAYDEYGKTALHTVCERKYGSPILEFFIKNGANIDVKSRKGTACLHEDDDHDENWHEAYGKTPLHFAVDFNNKVLIEKLLAYGADIHATDDVGSTCLHSVNRSSNQCFLTLLKAGADPNATNKVGITPLHVAAKLDEDSNFTCMRLLLIFDADVNEDFNKSLKPLAVATERNAHFLKAHMIAMNALGLYVSEDNRQLMRLTGTDTETHQKCKKELEILKTQKIGTSNISFYDVLSASSERLVDYADNKNLVESIRDHYELTNSQKLPFLRNAPYYGTLILAHLHQVMDHAKKMNLISLSLGHLKSALVNLFGKAVPEDLALQIIKCYSDKELENSVKRSNSRK